MLRRSLLFVALCVAGCSQTPSSGSDLRITYLSVGQGDCTVVQTGGHTILIDAGPERAGSKVVVNRLRDLGVEQVDLILLSHPDSDHTGGVKAVRSAYPGTRVAFSSAFQSHPDVRKDIYKWHQAPVWITGHRQMKVGKVVFDLLCPIWRPGDPDNDGSMFVRVVDGSAAATFSGDAPSAVEEWSIQQGFDPRCDVLHCGHHGSKYSSGLIWLRAAAARYGVLSCGRRNRYGHPHPDVLDRLRQVGTQAWRTDEQGEVTFVVRGGHLVPE